MLVTSSLIFLVTWLLYPKTKIRLPVLTFETRTKKELVEADWMRGYIDSLRSGATPREALQYSNPALIPNTLRQLRSYGLIQPALHQDALTQDSLLLRTLAICWQVSEDHGSSLIPALEAALEAHTDREQIRFEIANQLAGPKTAAVTLAILPILTLFLGQTLGIDTFSWVFSSWLTLAILMIGVSLLTAGTFLMLQLTKTIEKDLG